MGSSSRWHCRCSYLIFRKTSSHSSLGCYRRYRNAFRGFQHVPHVDWLQPTNEPPRQRECQLECGPRHCIDCTRVGCRVELSVPTILWLSYSGTWFVLECTWLVFNHSNSSPGLIKRKCPHIRGCTEKSLKKNGHLHAQTHITHSGFNRK